MKKIIHISDLHFGQINPETVEPLIQTIKKIKPDLVIISGDLTQRAKSSEYRQAKKFIQALPRPRLIIPGNHDIPVYNVLARLLQPRKNYRDHIAENLEPTYKSPELYVIGLNTTRVSQIKNGRISKRQRHLVEVFFSEAPEDAIKVIVTHHPFISTDGIQRRVIGARRAVEQLEEIKPDLFLSGHFHVGNIAHTAENFEVKNFSSLLVQAGTATSSRHRSETNTFNVIEAGKNALTISRYSWQEEKKEFVIRQREHFLRSVSGWSKAAGKK